MPCFLNHYWKVKGKTYFLCLVEHPYHSLQTDDPTYFCLKTPRLNYWRQKHNNTFWGPHHLKTQKVPSKGTLKKQKQDKHIGFVNHRLTSLLLKLLPFNSANGGVRQTDQLKHRAAFSTFTFIMQSNTTVINFNSFVMSLTLGSCTQTNENFKTLYDWTC